MLEVIRLEYLLKQGFAVGVDLAQQDPACAVQPQVVEGQGEEFGGEGGAEPL